MCWKCKLYLFFWPLDLLFLWAVVFSLKFLTALCQRRRLSGLSEVPNTFSFALIWLKSDECVMGWLRNVVWNCTWGSGFSGQKEIYEEVLGWWGGGLSFASVSIPTISYRMCALYNDVFRGHLENPNKRANKRVPILTQYEALENKTGYTQTRLMFF